jgi:hypothetical protein
VRRVRAAEEGNEKAMSTKDPAATPMRHLNHYTVVHDVDEGRAIQRINGVVSLPVGAIVELEPSVNARVEAVRLLTDATNNATVCLDVRRVR